MIDEEGFRPNVGIILSNRDGKVFWGKRIGQRSWQFPQGGINEGESDLDAMYRELHEEIGLLPEHVDVMGSTAGWLHYRLPKHLIRRRSMPRCIGQKQRWFLLRLNSDDSCVNLRATESPEFDGWRWVSHRRPAREVVYFKRTVYEKALGELSPLLPNFNQVSTR